jgi:uncharacterized protein
MSIWFYSGAFMIILGKYIVEPFFTKPSDAIANSTAVLIALSGLNEKHALLGYAWLYGYASSILLLSIVTIALKDSRTRFWKTVGRVTYWVVEVAGSSQVIFSVVYLVAAYSYFANPNQIPAFIGVITFWVCITFFDVVGTCVHKIAKLFHYLWNQTGDELGQAIGCDNPLLHNIEVDFSKRRPRPVRYGDLVAIETSPNVGSVGMVVNRRVLLNKEWLRIYLLQDANQDVLRIDLMEKKLITAPKSLFSVSNLVFALEPTILPKEAMDSVSSNPLYANRESFVGCVTHGSNINTVTFSILREEDNPEKRITEGVILKTPIYGEETLYQVINGNTRQEHLENLDTHGFTVGIARKLGKYDAVVKATKHPEVDAKCVCASFFRLQWFCAGSYGQENCC